MRYLIWICVLFLLTPAFHSTLFIKKSSKRLENQYSAVCKLLKLDNITSEAACGRDCKFDDNCIHFQYHSNECLVCTRTDISTKAEYTSVSVISKRPVSYFEKVKFCKNESTKCLARDCSVYRSQGYYKSGVYTIVTLTGKTIDVYCDMETAGGGWTIFQRRMDGSENFYRTWDEYEIGFGDVKKEFWLGNANISDIIGQGKYELRIDMADFDGTYVYAMYYDFTVNGNDYYRMDYTSFKGNTGNSFTKEKGQRFTAKDRDLDSSSSNCAVAHQGAWWYGACHLSNLNGLYLNGQHSAHADGVNWYSFRGYYYSLRWTEMKIRPSGYLQPYSLNSCDPFLPAPRDCADLRDRNVTTSGVYSIKPTSGTAGTLDVYCDMETDGGGWLVFQRRMDGSVDFLRGYTAYQHGFGNLSTEFWLGNDNISSITEQGSYEMRVDLEDFDTVKKYANYAAFSINRNDKYRLKLGSYNGNAGDDMRSGGNNANGHRWSTIDADNDSSGASNCASKFKGAWWYAACHRANLNGLYIRGSHSQHAVGVNWYSFRGLNYSLKFTEMKVRPSGYSPPS